MAHGIHAPRLDAVGARLTGADFKYGNFEGANFALSRAMACPFQTSFEGANLKGVNFRYAVWEGVNFRYADLRGASFTGVTFINCDFGGAKFDPGVKEELIQKGRIV